MYNDLTKRERVEINKNIQTLIKAHNEAYPQYAPYHRESDIGNGICIWQVAYSKKPEVLEKILESCYRRIHQRNSPQLPLANSRIGQKRIHNLATYIETKVVFEASHFWKDADKIPEVSFLKYPHRHLFYIELTKPVNHDDRDIEFIQFKHQVETYLLTTYPTHEFGGKSCETLAQELLEKFDCNRVSVKEDNENGAIVIVV